VKVVFSSAAKADLTELVELIAADKPLAARKWATKIRQTVTKLSDYPQLGRIVPEYDDKTIREILEGQYRIVYKVDEETDTIVIVTIWHSKKLLR